MLSGYTNDFPTDVLLDQGIIMVGNEKLGATKGPPQFGPNREIINLDFDGKTVPQKLLDRIFQGEPMISGAVLPFSLAGTSKQIDRMEPGFTSATSGATPNEVTTITPMSSGGFVAANQYLTDVRF